MKSTIGCIGLGLLGSAIAKRLLELGHQVIGYDLLTDKTTALEPDGLIGANCPAQVAAQCELILTCVLDTAALADVINGEHGILSAPDPAVKIIVDHSTCDIDTTRSLAQTLKQQAGIDLVDAPVSGGPGAALAGTLSIMAGGEPEPVENVRAVIEGLGRYTHMGGCGAGQATKLVNQTLVLPGYCIIAEAFRLAQAYGVDASKVPAALETGHAGSNLLPVLFERMIAEDFTPTGYARQILKDLEMLHTAAKAQTLSMPMTSQSLSLFRMLVAQGKGELDGAAIVSLLAKAAN